MEHNTKYYTEHDAKHGSEHGPEQRPESSPEKYFSKEHRSKQVDKVDGTSHEHDEAERMNTSQKLRYYFAFIVFSIFTASTLLVCIAVLLLNSLGILNTLGLKMFTALLVLIVCCVLVGTFIALLFGNSFLRPLNDLSSAMSRVAKGDFSVRLNERSRFRFAQRMNRDFNHMVDELSTVETLRNDFISNVSHEFKTPLSSIEGYATLLQERGLSPEVESEYVERILINSSRLSALVGNILMLSKIENQTMPMVRRKYRVDEQIRQSILMLEPKWAAKEIIFDMEMDNIEYEAIESLMGQVFINLIDNAIKFSPNAGTVYIELIKNDNQIIFRIANSGELMSNATIKRIFEKFYQGDTSHKSEGNGLGLSLVNKIVRLHNGYVTAAVTDAELNEFTVILPNYHTVRMNRFQEPRE